MSPSEFCFKPRREKATIIAFIDEKVKSDKAQQEKLQSKAR
jgi:hypothetical protein